MAWANAQKPLRHASGVSVFRNVPRLDDGSEQTTGRLLSLFKHYFGFGNCEAIINSTSRNSLIVVIKFGCLRCMIMIKKCRV